MSQQNDFVSIPGINITFRHIQESQERLDKKLKTLDTNQKRYDQELKEKLQSSKESQDSDSTEK